MQQPNDYTHTPMIAAVTSTGWTISIIAILIVVAIAWKVFRRQS
ncbi:MAG: hypothetical protein ACRDPM_24310 [Solirubrobacteraceae bacterium]